MTHGTSKQAEWATRHSPEFLQTVIDSIPDVLVVIDRQRRVVLTNRAARQAGGGRDPVAEGLACHQVLYQRRSPCSESAHPCPLEQVLATKAPVEVVHTHHDTDGKETFIRITAAPVFNESGEVTRIIESCRDITARTQAEEGQQGLLRDMGERIKEQQCIYGVADSIRKRETLEEIFRDVTELIPRGWRYPEITRAKIRYGQAEYVLQPFEETQWRQASQIIVGGQPVGSVEVYYLEQRPELAEGPFLKEERDLLDGIAQAISEAVELRRAEQERESLAKFPGENPGPVARFTASGQVLYANAAARMLIAALGDGSGLATPAQWQKVVEQALESGRHQTFDIQHQRRTFLIEVVPISGAGYANLYGRDITERKDAEERLKRSSALLWGIMERTPDAIYLKDQDGRYQLANSAAARALGKTSPEEVIGTDDMSLLPAKQARRIRENDRRIMASGESGVSEEVIEVAGDTRVFLTSRSPYRDENGKVTGIIGVAHDVTNRKQAQREREKLISELEAKNAELERFTYTVSHDLKSPLLTIKGFSGYLLKDVAGGRAERLKGDISRIDSAAGKMEQLLDELLELSRIGRVVNRPAEVLLGDLVREAVSAVAFRVESKGVQIRISPHLPVVWGDGPRLVQTLQNLIENAAKFMGDQAKPCIEIGARQEGDEVLCFVRDNGMGIEPQYYEKVFGLFEKLDQGMAEGTGIGLSLVKRIIEVHGGRIWIESQGPGHGSTFWFTLPQKGGSSDGKS